MESHKTRNGIIAALSISITAAISLPLVNVFKTLTPSELMMVRGGVTCAIVAAIFFQRIRLPSKQMINCSFLFSFATLTFYSSIRQWGASPTLVVVTITPMVNVLAKRLRGHGVDDHVYLCLTGLIAGVMIALNPWQASFDLHGILYSLGAVVFVGIGFELLAKEKGIDPYNKTFWIAMATIGTGLIATLWNGHLPFTTESWNLSQTLALTGFGIVGGFFYYVAYIIAFENLKTEVASTLAMAETPAVIVGAWLMLGETMTLIQWIGVLIALGSTLILSFAERKAPEIKTHP